jgi:phosphoribosylformylglycinamidine cyclo-ligase
VFRWLAETAQMAEPELLKTFNCGIGMIAVVAADRAAELKALLEAEGETVTVIGTVTAGQGVAYTGALL